MSVKKRKYNSLFKHQSVRDLLNLNGSYQQLFNLLTEQEVDKLYDLNVIFIRTASPSSQIELKKLDINGDVIFLNIEANLFTRLLPGELIAIILHEIGHVFNPGIIKMEGEYVADAYAKSKGYTNWIISSLQRGVENRWIGFDEAECNLRIQRLQKK